MFGAIGAQIARRAAERRQLRGGRVRRRGVGGHVEAGQLRRRALQRRVARSRRCRRSRRHVVVSAVAIDAGHAAMGVLARAPTAADGALAVLVALQTGLRLCGGAPLLKAEDHPRLLAAALDVLAGRAVAGLALPLAMDVVGKRLDVGVVAGHADFVVVDELRPRHHRQRRPHFAVRDLHEQPWIRLRRAIVYPGLRAAAGLVRRLARGKADAKDPD